MEMVASNRLISSVTFGRTSRTASRPDYASISTIFRCRCHPIRRAVGAPSGQLTGRYRARDPDVSQYDVEPAHPLRCHLHANARSCPGGSSLICQTYTLQRDYRRAVPFTGPTGTCSRVIVYVATSGDGNGGKQSSHSFGYLRQNVPYGVQTRLRVNLNNLPGPLAPVPTGRRRAIGPTHGAVSRPKSRCIPIRRRASPPTPLPPPPRQCAFLSRWQ